MTGWAGTDEAVYCCFCGEILPRRSAAILTVAPPSAAPDDSQTVYCHGRCFVPLLDPRIPYHSELGADVEPEFMQPRVTAVKPN